MSNPLKTLSLQELWALFPIVLSPHQPQWVDWAREEIATLSGLLVGFSPILNHIGSTAIPDIQAKPIIDILVEMPAEAERTEIQKILFRDYLRNHPDTAREYEALKLSLLPEYKHNRDGYTEAKTEFVKRVMAAAKRISSPQIQ